MNDDAKRIHEALMVCCQEARKQRGSLMICPAAVNSPGAWCALIEDEMLTTASAAYAASPEGALIALAKELQA